MNSHCIFNVPTSDDVTNECFAICTALEQVLKIENNGLSGSKIINLPLDSYHSSTQDLRTKFKLELHAD